MWKAALAGTTALAIAGSTLVYAQQRDMRGPEMRGPEMRGMMGDQTMREHMRGQIGTRGQPNLEDMRAFSEARIAALRAGLLLNPEQEKNWPAFEQAAREVAALRVDRVRTAVERRRDNQPRSTDPIERLRRQGERMQQTGAALKKLAEATDPLYKSLDDGQKRRFAMLARFAQPRRGMDGGTGGMDGGTGGMGGGMTDGMRRHFDFGGRSDRGPRDGQDRRGDRERFQRQGFDRPGFDRQRFQHPGVDRPGSPGLDSPGSYRGPGRSGSEPRGSSQDEEQL
jgi:hypothetical protein